MDILLGIIIVSLVFCVGLLLLLLGKVQKLLNSQKKTKPDPGLTRSAQAKLREEASHQYEAMMVRELQRFEKNMQKFSDELLSSMQQRVGQPDVDLEKTVDALVAATTQGYGLALEESVAALKARLSSLDALLVTHAEAADKDVQTLVAERKAKAVARVDASLASIFSDYMSTVASELDFSNQQDYIVAQLEAIKPQLKEDIQRAS